MSQFFDNPVETLNEWNSILGNGCCCSMPECPAPTLECQSVSGTALPSGFMNPDDEDWRIYPIWTFTDTFSYSESVTDTHCAGGTFEVVSGSGSGNYTFTQTNTATEGGSDVAEIQIGGSGEGCFYSAPDLIDSCGGSSSWTRETFEDWCLSCYGTGNVTASGVDPSVTTTIVGEFVGGEPDGAGGSYPDCWFKFTSTSTDHYRCHSCTPGYCDGADTDTPTTNTYYDSDFGDLGSNGGTWDTYTEGDGEYQGAVPWSVWLDNCRGVIEGHLDFETEACLASECSSLTEHPAEAPAAGNDLVSLTLRKFRYRVAIPQNFEGEYYKVEWDEGEFPAEGDAVLLAKRSWEWAGPGDPENPDSWVSGWYEVDPPDMRGQRRVVNLKFQCYHGTTYGARMQKSGEQYDFENPPNQSGQEGQTGQAGNVGRLSTGTLKTGGLRTGGLRSGDLRAGGLRTGGLRSGNLRSGGTRTGGLRTGSL